MCCLDLFMRLYLLDRGGGLGISSLAKSLEISVYLTTKFLNQLIAKKLVRRLGNRFICTLSGIECAVVIYRSFPETNWLVESVNNV